MKHIILLLALAPFLLFAEEDLKSVIQIVRTSSELDPSLKGNKTVYEFEFHSYGQKVEGVQVYYSIDGINNKQMSKNGIISVPSKAGRHIFQFFYNEHYLEIYSDSLTIEAKYRDRYSVNLVSSVTREYSLKPIIYLYPQLTTDISVKIDIHGEDAFLYPTYAESWDFTAESNGDLLFDDGQTYNYLFWEAAHGMALSPEQTQSGFFVKGENAIDFLEEKLTTAGFNSKEQADFITFWGPRMSQNKLNFVHFEFNETCDKYANLDISPKPDNLYRIYMVWGSVSDEYKIETQEIEQFYRSGFSVLEWGGQESNIRRMRF